jgi:hypothetical protein
MSEEEKAAEYAMTGGLTPLITSDFAVKSILDGVGYDEFVKLATEKYPNPADRDLAIAGYGKAYGYYRGRKVNKPDITPDDVFIRNPPEIAISVTTSGSGRIITQTKSSWGDETCKCDKKEVYAFRLTPKDKELIEPAIGPSNGQQIFIESWDVFGTRQDDVAKAMDPNNDAGRKLKDRCIWLETREVGDEKVPTPYLLITKEYET